MLSGTLTAGAQAAHQPKVTSKQLPNVLVVGAGLIGSSVAMHLAKSGCKVTVVEASQPASGAMLIKDFTCFAVLTYLCALLAKRHTCFSNFRLCWQVLVASPGLG